MLTTIHIFHETLGPKQVSRGLLGLQVGRGQQRLPILRPPSVIHLSTSSTLHHPQSGGPAIDNVLDGEDPWRNNET